MGDGPLNITFSVAHIQTFVCFVKSKTKRFVYMFHNNIIFRDI